METTGRRLRIGISGSYGGMNLGDEAILDGMLSQLRATVPADITVFSRNPSDTLSRHKIEHAIPVRSLTRKEITPEVQHLDLLVLGGGGILYDRDAEVYLREVLLAHELGIPVILYAVSAGPLTLQASRRAVAEALNAAASPVITVRDRLGYRLLEDVGVTQPIHLTADPALLLEPEEPPVDALIAEGVQLERHLVGFSVREPAPPPPTSTLKTTTHCWRTRRTSWSNGMTPTWSSSPWNGPMSSTATRWLPTCRTPSERRSCGVGTHRGRSCPSWAGSTSRSACGCTS